ncbi:MAG: DUF502 domain-containing protein [Chitinispirillia bacterium]|jgi:uncharacterized membrane protein
MINIAKIFRQIRGNIVTGILLLIPAVTTIYLIIKIFSFVDSILPNIFHSLIPYLPETWITGVGLVLLLIMAYFVGLAAKNYFGNMIIEAGNAIISSIPLINKIYLGVQQVIDSVAGRKKNLFEKAVLIEYPKKDSYCIGFVTSDKTGEIQKKTDRDLFSIFVPTTPNPTSGFLLFIPKTEVIELEIGIETAIKIVMSFGMVNTEHLNKTNHMYKLPKHIKDFNWLGIFKGQKSYKPPDPRD